jgi:hypothetical protein
VTDEATEPGRALAVVDARALHVAVFDTDDLSARQKPDTRKRKRPGARQ